MIHLARQQISDAQPHPTMNTQQRLGRLHITMLHMLIIQIDHTPNYIRAILRKLYVAHEHIVIRAGKMNIPGRLQRRMATAYAVERSRELRDGRPVPPVVMPDDIFFTILVFLFA